MGCLPRATATETNDAKTVNIPKCIDHIAQKPKATLAKKVQTHLRTVLRVYFACIMICVLVYAPSHEIR